MFESLKRFLPGGRKAADPAARRAERERLAAVAAAAQAEADRHAAALDERDRLDYYTDSRGPFWLHYVAIGKPPFGSPEERACWPEPPTRAQWAKLTPAQKADTVNPVLPEDLPA